MMACSSNAELVKCDSNSDDANNANGCGSDIAFPYFISFYVLCSFLVSALSVIEPHRGGRGEGRGSHHRDRPNDLVAFPDFKIKNLNVSVLNVV